MPNISKKSEKEARKQYGYFTAWVGVLANLLLSVSKFIVGLLSNSVAIMADSVNNLSDIGTSVLALFSFKISAKVPVEDHPFGHARFEYVLSFVMSVIIMFIGGQFLFESVKKVLNPSEVKSTTITLVILILSIAVKLWLYFFYKKMSRKIDSEILNAASGDSLSDILATSVILVSIIMGPFLSFNIDGVIGSIVAVIIITNGFDILGRVLDLIVGSNLHKKEQEKIRRWLNTCKGVLGIHDLIIHDYGPGHRFVTVHIEVDSRISLLEAHAIVDDIENDAVKLYNWQMVAHIDPLDVADPELQTLREMTNAIVMRINENLSIHDFRVIHGPQITKLVFDCEVPSDVKEEDKQLKKRIQHELNKEDRIYEATITFDRNYIRSSVK